MSKMKNFPIMVNLNDFPVTGKYYPSLSIIVFNRKKLLAELENLKSFFEDKADLIAMFIKSVEKTADVFSLSLDTNTYLMRREATDFSYIPCFYLIKDGEEVQEFCDINNLFEDVPELLPSVHLTEIPAAA